LGGRLLLAETANEQERQLLNIVEQMAIASPMGEQLIASGIPCPKSICSTTNKRINAFAAGFSLNLNVIYVTLVPMQQFNRNELQCPQNLVINIIPTTNVET